MLHIIEGAARAAGMRMLEKLFGKRSTGIIWMISAGILLFLLAGFLASYFLWKAVDLYSLLGYALFIALALVLITLPAVVQKKFKLYIPPFVQSGICVYAVLYLVNDLLPAPQKEEGLALVQVNFLPAIGGFFLCAAIFSVVYSLLRSRAARKGKKLAEWAVPLVTFFVTTLLLVLINMPALFIALPPFSHGADNVAAALVNAAGYETGAFAFCLTGWATMLTGRSEWYTIRSFRNAERAKSEAVQRGNRTLLTVVENMERDRTDYKKLLRRTKAQFYLARIVFLAFYAAYLVFSCIGFYETGGVGYAVIVLTAAGFALTAAVYLYEFYLFRRNALNQRLRKLKIVRTAVKLYTFLLTAFATMAANFHYLPVTALVAVGMAVFNLAVLFYNLFGKPRRYPAAPPMHRHEPKQAPSDMAPAEGAHEPQGADMPPADPPEGVPDDLPDDPL